MYFIVIADWKLGMKDARGKALTGAMVACEGQIFTSQAKAEKALKDYSVKTKHVENFRVIPLDKWRK